MTSETVIGKFWIILLLNMDLKYISDVWQIIIWYYQVSLAVAIYLLEKTLNFTRQFLQNPRPVFYCHQYMVENIIFVELELSTKFVYNIVYVPDVEGDIEPHIFEICYAKDVRNYLLVETSLYGT